MHSKKLIYSQRQKDWPMQKGIEKQINLQNLKRLSLERLMNSEKHLH